MKKNPPKRGEQLAADLDRWQLEMSDEIGIVEANYRIYNAITPRPAIRSLHKRPFIKCSPKK